MITMDDGTVLEIGTRVRMLNPHSEQEIDSNGRVADDSVEEGSISGWLRGGFNGQKKVGAIVHFGGSQYNQFEFSFLGCGVWVVGSESRYYGWQDGG